jgi:hypothetical protein
MEMCYCLDPHCDGGWWNTNAWYRRIAKVASFVFRIDNAMNKHLSTVSTKEKEGKDHISDLE